MPVEIEAKIKVADLAIVRQKLKSVGAELAGEVLETNTFFDTEDRSLLAADEGLRLRHMLRRSGAGEKEAFIVTYKGPRKHGQLKSREEIEMGVTEGRDAVALFGAIGFKRVLSFQKRRESWTLGGCHVELDELPHLGTYVEIEGPAEDQILRVRDQLGLNEAPLVRASYIAMLMTYLQEHGNSTKQVNFSNAGSPTGVPNGSSGNEVQ